MKLKDLLEYNMGIQGKDANAKSNVDEPELDVPGDDPTAKDNDIQKKLAQGSRKVGAIAGKKIQGNQFATGADKVAQGKMPNKTELKQLAPVIGDVTKAMTNPKFANRLGAILKQAGKEGVDESSLAKKILKKLTTKKSMSGIRKRSKLLQEAKPELFELNFNTKEIANAAMDLPIRCGFEAETTWPGLQGGADDDIDNLSWDEVQDEIYVGNSYKSDVDEGFSEWLREEKLEEFLDDMISDWIDENKEDENYINDFIDSGNGPSSEAIDRYKTDFEERDPGEYENRLEDGWEYMNWAREYVEEEYEDEYRDFLQEMAAEEGDLHQRAMEEAYENYAISDWIYDSYSSMSSFLDDYGIEYSSYGSGGLQEVASWMEEWAGNNSFETSSVDYGEYGSTHTDGWGVEDDSSIDGEGCGAEIISPVYPTPRAMLKEMKSLFSNMEKEGTETNSSTGLHVTMTWNGEAEGLQSYAKAEKLKMATLLGDEYLLNTFGRKNNGYAKSQAKKIRVQAQNLAKGDLSNLEKMQDVLGQGVSTDKFSSIHFKDLRDNRTGTKLIEFRIGGGEDYHLAENFKKVVSAVIRYATVMEAGYTDKYKADYAKAIARTVEKAGKIDPKELERAKVQGYDTINSPLVDLFKEMLSKDNYFDGLQEISQALSAIEMYNRSAGKLKEDENDQATKYLSVAQNNYAKALGRLAIDVEKGKSRKNINAKAIGVIRNSLKIFQISESELSKLITANIENVNIPTQNDRPDQKFVVLKKGVDALFKKDIVERPTFLRAPQIEKAVQGLWNAVQSAEPKELDKIGDTLAHVTVKDNDYKEDNISNAKYAWQQIMQKREFNDFYQTLLRGGYNASYTLLPNGDVYNKDKYLELMTQLKKYPHYEEPVSPSHSKSINNDDSYIENYLSTYTMKLRKRFIHLQDMKDTNLQLYIDSIKDIGKLSQPLVDKCSGTTITGDNELLDPKKFDALNIQDGLGFLRFSDYKSERIQGLIDDIEKNDFEDPFGDNIVARLNDALSDAVRDSLQAYYLGRQNHADEYKHDEVIKIVNSRFDAIKDWMSGFDKIAQKMGFDSQEKEIAAKRSLDDKEKNFDKNVRDNNRPRLKLPSFSSAYMDSTFYDKCVDNARYAGANREAFTSRMNKGGDVLVIAAAHESQGQDAVEILSSLTRTEDTPEGTTHEWRRDGVKAIIKQFKLHYGIFPQDIYAKERTDTEGRPRPLSGQKYKSLSATEYQALKKAGIEIETGVGDSREPHVSPLVPKDKLANPKSGEPWSTTSAVMWSMNDDKAEQKRFDAYTDWDKLNIKFELPHTSIKQEVAELIAKGENFHRAFKQVVDQKRFATPDQNDTPRNKLYAVAGVEGLEDAASLTISRNTDWPAVAQHLGIDKGIKDQGINLLKKVYTTFDNQPSSKRSGYGIERWAGCIEDADKYIKKHYTVSAGNYSRDGETVSDVYGNDYEKGDHPWGAEGDTDYILFNNMMAMGMDDYMLTPEVNKLVAFLKNSQNDETFKDAVLQGIKSNAESSQSPVDFTTALTLGRQRLNARNESMINTNMANVFENFENLSLDDQLKIIRNDKISESLADLTSARLQKQQAQQQDHKEEMITIWDNRPWPLPGSYSNQQLKDMGFKRFNAGWKVSKSKFDAIANPVRKVRAESLQATDLLIRAKVLSENLPNNNKIDAINSILSKDFPVGDLDIQFKAFMAMPIPRMMTDFSKLHSAQGYQADGGDIVRHYAMSRLSDEDVKKLKLNENKSDLITKLNDLPDDENTNKLINYVEQLINDMGVGGRLQSLSAEIETIPDDDVKKAVRQIAKIVASVEMSPEERAKLFVDWKADKLVNVDALLSAQTVTLSDIFIGYGTTDHITELVDDLVQVVQYGIGPGEFALAVLSQRISGMGASTGADGGKGDLVINGQPIELKTTRKNAARFNDREVTVSNDYKSLVAQFFTKYKDKIIELESSGIKVKVGSGMQQAHVANFLKAVPEAQAEIGNIISNIFTNLPAVGGNIAGLLKAQNINGAMQSIAQANVNNYLAKKRQSGNLAGILFIDLKKETFNFIKDVSDLEGSGLRLHAKTNYLVTTNENPFANTQIVPGSYKPYKTGVSESVDTACPRTKALECHCESINSLTEAQETIKALCEFEHTIGKTKGIIYLKQEAGKPTVIHGNITGLTEGEHGFHIHEFGDLSKGCESAGGHYNPDNIAHGSLEEGHVGDLGNIVADSNGNAQFKLTAERVDLTGDRSVVGRAIVIHADKDDLGKGGDEESTKTGNAGERLGCGVIRLMNLDESTTTLHEDPNLASLRQGGLYKRAQMPQLKLRHLSDPKWHDQVRDTFGITIKTKKGTIGIDKIRPGQIDRVPGLSDSAKKFFAKGQQVEPFIIDNNGVLVNGHHRYDAAMMLGIQRVPFVLVDRTIHELVKMFGPGSDMNVASPGGKLDLVAKDGKAVDPELRKFANREPKDDPKMIDLQRRLDKRMSRSDKAKQGWAKRKANLAKDSGQQELPFDVDA